MVSRGLVTSPHQTRHLLPLSDHVTYRMMHFMSVPPTHPLDRMTDACENITFTRAGGNDINNYMLVSRV